MSAIENGAQRPVAMVMSRLLSCGPRLKLPTLATACVAVGALSAIAWQTASAFPPSAPLARRIVSGAIGPASGTGNRSPSASAAAPASSAAAGPTARAPDEKPVAIAQQLAELKAAYERMVHRAEEVEHRLDRFEADVADLRQQLEKSHAAQAKAQRHAKALARKLRLAQTAASAQVRAIQQQPKVLSVDTWNGRPSVSVQVGTEVRFLSEGDVVANWLLRNADSATQRVEFVSTTGTLMRNSAAPAGEAR